MIIQAKKKNILTEEARQKKNAANKKYKDRNKDKKSAARINRKIDSSQWFFALKSKLTHCPICGKDVSPYDIDFHHADGELKRLLKLKDISTMVRDGYAKASVIMALLSHCVYMCSTCHRKQTSVETIRFRRDRPLVKV